MVVRFVIAAVLTSLLAGPAAAEPAAAPLPACPAVFAHGGYPTGANAWERDQVRQPNTPPPCRTTGTRVPPASRPIFS